MSEDEKILQLRIDWDEFYNTDLVQAIVDRKGETNPVDATSDLITQYAANITSHTQQFFEDLKDRHKPEYNINKVIDSLNNLINEAVSPKSIGGYDKEVKDTYDLIFTTDEKIKKVLVSKEFLMDRLKEVWGILKPKMTKILDGNENKTTDNDYSNFKYLIFAINNFTENKHINVLSNLGSFMVEAYKFSKGTKGEDSKIKINNMIKRVDEFLETKSSPQEIKSSNPTSPQPASPLTGPLHISFTGNKYSVVGSKNDDSHEMIYDKTTKCWNEKVPSGGATKSKKKRGPKSREKSSTKSRPKSRRY